jgi:hypothetical protein
MTNPQIVKMLKAIIQEVDYDIYKNLFVTPEDKDESGAQVTNLVEIVKGHLK